ncbi:VCBS domain-containing protein, partial [Ferrovum sp. PN-J185]|uniref:VCBS domain-containing protein n=1 Tax=Ferrovum sp. PN-J185 TaxID=1356306 RepID=UPI001E29F145
MADVTTTDSSEGSSQINSDAQHLDNLTSLQQSQPTINSNVQQTNQVTHQVASQDIIAPDNPSIVNKPTESSVPKSNPTESDFRLQIQENTSSSSVDNQVKSVQIGTSGGNDVNLHTNLLNQNLLNNGNSNFNTIGANARNQAINANGVAPPHVGVGTSKSVGSNASSATIASVGSSSTASQQAVQVSTSSTSTTDASSSSSSLSSSVASNTNTQTNNFASTPYLAPNETTNFKGALTHGSTTSGTEGSTNSFTGSIQLNGSLSVSTAGTTTGHYGTLTLNANGSYSYSVNE